MQLLDRLCKLQVRLRSRDNTDWLMHFYTHPSKQLHRQVCDQTEVTRTGTCVFQVIQLINLNRFLVYLLIFSINCKPTELNLLREI